MNKYVEMSKEFVCTILSNHGEPTVEGIAELLEIRMGNEKVLLEHIKAINAIFNEAIKELERSGINESN